MSGLVVNPEDRFSCDAAQTEEGRDTDLDIQMMMVSRRDGLVQLQKLSVLSPRETSCLGG